MELIKYANRKLYVKKQGYVNNAFLLEEVKKGTEIVVIDHKTKKDVTNKTLKIAIMENLEISNDALIGLLNDQTNQVQA